MNVSIIIPTYKRKESLLRLLQSLVSEMKVGYEIIIVEQFENHEKEIKSIARKKNLSYLRYFYLEKPSMTNARNVGVTYATGEVILFLDDDVIVKPFLIENHLRNYDDQSVGGVAGRVLLQATEKDTNTGKTGRISFFGNCSDGFNGHSRQEVDTVIGANMSWRKSLIKAVGGFDEQFTGNALREESDVSLRVKALGYKLVFEPEAVIQDMREPTGGARKTEGRIQWYFDFFSNETYFFLKHRPWVVVPIILLTRWEWAMRCMFGFGREVSWRSMRTPIAGVLDGIRKYRRLKIK